MLNQRNWTQVQQKAAADPATLATLIGDWPPAAAAIKQITGLTPDAADQAYFDSNILGALMVLSSPPAASVGYGQRDCVVAATDVDPNKSGTA